MHASSGLDRAATRNHMAQAASPPTLAKNARMGHPLWERCRQKPLKAGHPPGESKHVQHVGKEYHCLSASAVECGLCQF
jgi:hypothetical protein